MVSIFYGVAVLVDMLLTGILIAILLKSRTGFRRSVSILLRNELADTQGHT